jgi:hypothetical protein
MKIHLISGAAIGATINLAFQLTDPASNLNLIEVAMCAVLAALAAALASWFQQPPQCAPLPFQIANQNSKIKNSTPIH